MTTPMQKIIWFAAVLLFLFHHDFWFWDDRTLLFGFLPIGLAYHTLFSIAAGCLWACAVKFAWPTHIEEFAKRENPAAETKAERK